eukprot:9490494-Pyramimonas_sp.AAC.1
MRRLSSKRESLWDTRAQSSKPTPPLPMSLHPQEAAARGPPARSQSDAGAMETKAKAKAKARAKIIFAALSRKRDSARVGRIVGSPRPRPTIRDAGSTLAAAPPVQTD